MADETGKTGTIPTPEQFDKLWNSIVRYFRRKPIRASVYCLLVLTVLVAPAIGFALKLREAEKLKDDLNAKRAELQDKQSELQDERREHSECETRYSTLNAMVAPIMRQAAEQFPGEDISDSLRKLVARLELQPAYTIFLNGVVLEEASVIRVPKGDFPLEFAIMNTGSASTRELLFSFGVPRAATNLLSWDRRWKIHSPVIGNLKLDESVIWLRSGYEERFHVGDAIYFLGLCFQRFSDIYVLGAGVSVKTDTGDDRIWSLWFIPAQESDADSAILTGERATNALNSLDPRIIQSLESSQQIMTLWKEP